jgi:single-strand selective monofunctional uracil DNA glycosylase
VSHGASSVVASCGAMTPTSSALMRAAEKLRDDVNRMRFKKPVAYVYNPLDYAWAVHAQFIERFASTPKRIVFVGMNPGPWGMAQTGVPFGEVRAVTTWMKLDAAVGKPKREHPKRPVDGLACARSEVSGARLWGAIAARHPHAATFFDEPTRAFVVNFCPLLFLEESGRNITPDKLPAKERVPLEEACRAHLAHVIISLHPEIAIGVGAYAAKQLKTVISSTSTSTSNLRSSSTMRWGMLPHPSPASPAANRGWTELARTSLQKLHVEDVL